MTTTRRLPSPSMRRRRRPWSSIVACRPPSAMSGSMATGTGGGAVMTGSRAAGSVRRRAGSGCLGSGAVTASAGIPMAGIGSRIGHRSAWHRSRSGHGPSSIRSRFHAPPRPCIGMIHVRSGHLNHTTRRPETARRPRHSLPCQRRPTSCAGPGNNPCRRSRHSSRRTRSPHPGPRLRRAGRRMAGGRTASGSRIASLASGVRPSPDGLRGLASGRQAAARCSRSRTPSQAGSAGGVSTQISLMPGWSSSRSTANSSCAQASAPVGM